MFQAQKFRLKAMAAAVLLAASGMASAQIAVPATGNGSLTFVAYDPVALTTYSFNTGRFFQSFLPGSAVTTPGHTFSLTLPSWNTFLTTAGVDASRVLWGVFAADAIFPTGLMTTAATAGNFLGLGRVNTANNSFIGTFQTQHNFHGTHGSSPNGFAIYQTTAAGALIDSAYGGHLFGTGNNFNGNAGFTVVGNIGQSLGYYLFTGSNIGVNACTAGACTRHAYRDPSLPAALGTATWTLTSGGELVYTAPVPEASTYAMMLAGLLTLGFVARRRMGGK